MTPKVFSETSELEDPEPAMSALELQSESDVDDSDSDESASSSHEVAEPEDILSFWLGFSASMANDKSGGLQFVTYVCYVNFVSIGELMDQYAGNP